MTQKDRHLESSDSTDLDNVDQENRDRVNQGLSRRGFVKGLASATATLGASVVYSNQGANQSAPALSTTPTETFTIEGKDGLRLLSDHPINAETPPHLLNDDITPINRMFVRNNGIPPQSVNFDTWTLTVDGESVQSSKTYLISDLKSRFKNISRQLIVECGGNGRAEFDPRVSGNQWTLGAVGCPIWDGIRLKDVLEDCGYSDDAVYVAYHSADTHLSGDKTREPISRGVPISKALEEESMISWGMNGEDLHPLNGHPLRLVIGGWPGSVSGKWINRISIRDRVHDGAKMASPSYRVPCEPVAPGAEVSDDNMCIIHAMPVKSLITQPRSGTQHLKEEPLHLHGHAWSGHSVVQDLRLSIDFGQTWHSAELQPPVNRLAWQNWDYDIEFPSEGYFEVWARAIDANGVAQPMVLPGWNPKGYLNNACHRIAVYVS